jgi:hypothetical protein
VSVPVCACRHLGLHEMLRHGQAGKLHQEEAVLTGVPRREQHRPGSRSWSSISTQLEPHGSCGSQGLPYTLPIPRCIAPKCISCMTWHGMASIMSRRGGSDAISSQFMLAIPSLRFSVTSFPSHLLCRVLLMFVFVIRLPSPSPHSSLVPRRRPDNLSLHVVAMELRRGIRMLGSSLAPTEHGPCAAEYPLGSNCRSRCAM